MPLSSRESTFVNELMALDSGTSSVCVCVCVCVSERERERERERKREIICSPQHLPDFH